MSRALKLLSGVFLLSFILAPAVTAQSDSTINQQILAMECSYTTVETGLGRMHDSTCPFFAPTIAKISVRGGRPVITGIYDAIHATILRVQVGGVWYVLGSSVELTADGNVWVLNLSGLKQPLAEGEYSIVVEARGDDGKVRRGRTSLTIQDSRGQGVVEGTPVQTPAPGKGTTTPGVPKPEEPEGPEEPARPSTPATSAQEAVRTSFVPLVLLVVLIGWVLLFTLSRRRRTRESRWGAYYDIMHK